jgi:uncharacterized protein with HEPN domain
MTQHDDRVGLRHMADYAREAVGMIEGKKRADLPEDRMLELSLVRLIEVIGEAAARVTSEGREKYGSIPRPQVVGMRNRLIHGYDQVELDVLWDTIEYDLPPYSRFRTSPTDSAAPCCVFIRKSHFNIS